jgi:hypothetical protein
MGRLPRRRTFEDAEFGHRRPGRHVRQERRLEDRATRSLTARRSRCERDPRDARPPAGSGPRERRTERRHEGSRNNEDNAAAGCPTTPAQGCSRSELCSGVLSAASAGTEAPGIPTAPEPRWWEPSRPNVAPLHGRAHDIVWLAHCGALTGDRGRAASVLALFRAR